jgi:hypothetical protein
VVAVTAAASVLFFRPEFDDFLYAPIGAANDEMPLSVLSALSRLNIDPWVEAAELSKLSAATATQRLALLIARLPCGRWASADVRAIAGGLIKLLPDRRSIETSLVSKTHVQGMKGSTVVLICVALGLAGLLIAAVWERSRGDGGAGSTINTTSPPQSSPPASR